MDRILDRNNIESIKKTMQMHENIFKHQVRELHRVYSVQKMLMVELKNEIRQQKIWNTMNDTDASHPLSILRGDLDSRERSGSCYKDTMKMQRGFDVEKPAEASFESCKTSFGSGYNEEMEVDLTLSIGGSHVKKLNSCDSTKSDRVVGECSDIIITSSTVTITRERNGPHWISQGLQLK